MSEQKERAGGSPDKSRTDFFTVGSPLHAVRPGYISRPADDALFHAVLAGKDAYLFAQAHSGKTSLIAATAARLQTNGYQVANLDLAQIGERDAGSDAARWYYSIAYRMLRQLRIKVDLQDWWQDKSILSHRQRLFEFYVEVLLANTRSPVAVFIDELQSIAGLEIAQHLLESITAVNKARVTEPELERLTFVLAGECDEALLMSDAESSPFRVMEPIRLDNFSRAAIDTYASELGLGTEAARVALDRIYYWTAGQPYLTQKLCRTVAREQDPGDVAALVDRVVLNQFGSRSSVAQEPHLARMQRRIVDDRRNYESVLNLYGRVRKGIAVPFEHDAISHRILASLGLVRQRPDGNIGISNRVYELAFTAHWANQNLPLHWRGPAIAAGLLLLFTAIPFWYTQLLPRPYARILTSPTMDMETVADAHNNLRSFPGHVQTADRLFVSQLQARARETDDELGVTLLANFAAAVPGQEQLSERLIAQFWDRQALKALRAEQRDTALLSSIKALVLPTAKRRRAVQSLIGDDYPYLRGTLSVGSPERLVFDAEHRLLTTTDGARVSQWALGTESRAARPPWVLSALEVTPLLRRVITDRAGSVSRIGLTVNISHQRLDDIRMRLIAPSGRATEIELSESSSSANEVLRIPAAALQDLVGETLSGTWTLSIRDEARGTAGHLVAWNLSLNSQVVEESFARGLDISEPSERESDRLWFSADGRFAIARAQQSDGARLWDLNYQQAARTIPVPASEDILGVSDDADSVVSSSQSTVSVWNARTGRLAASIDLGVAGEVTLLGDGRHLLLTGASDVDTTFELWRLQDGVQLASLVVSGSPALAVADPQGMHLAVADYDQSVRVWNFLSGDLVSQLDLSAPPNDLQLAPGGRALAVRFGSDSIALWHLSRPDRPLLIRRAGDDASDRFRFAFSPSGERFATGSPRRGYQVFRTQDGRPLAPPLGAGFSTLPAELLGFSEDEDLLVIADAAGEVSTWDLPVDAPGDGRGIDPDNAGRWQWRDGLDSVAMLAPGGQRLAVGDVDGHVHIVNATPTQSADVEDLSFLGHVAPVSLLEFNTDGSLVASAATDGSIRVWDAVSGLPRRYRASMQSPFIDAMTFSPSGAYLAAMGGRRVKIISVESGATVAEQELPERHSDLAFGADDRLYLAGESGMLRSLAAGSPANWSLGNEWQGLNPLRQIEISSARQLMVIVDSQHTVQVLDVLRGSIGTGQLELPDAVIDVQFSSNESHALLRTSRWVHRVSISRSGVDWRSAVLAPDALAAAGMAVDNPAGAAGSVGPERLLVLKREGRTVDVEPLDFSHATGRPSIGDRRSLLDEWQEKLGVAN